MAKTKLQKQQAVEKAVEELKKSQTVVFADFTGLPVNEMNAFRKTLKAAGLAFSVVKKRLLKLILKNQGIEFDPKSISGQTGVLFSNKDLVETAGIAYKFSKEKKDLFKILGGFEIQGKKFIEGKEVIRYGELPPREVLLGQLVGMLTIPIRKFLFVLDQKSKKTVEK